jgi:caffeoyl-CoA O-methyltransferase
MQITPDEGAFLTFLARLVGARRALEVGTFTGYSAISIARGLADGGTLTCLELEQEFATIAARNVEAAGLSDQVEIRVGPAEAALRAMPEEPTYDFAFLDADKTTYPAYYELIVPRLAPGGLLAIDNVLLRGAVIDPQDDRARTVADLNDRITADDRVDSVMIFVADGLTLARRR